MSSFIFWFVGLDLQHCHDQACCFKFVKASPEADERRERQSSTQSIWME
jgi:hypothetical protein